MTILVTGVAGFVGYHLAARLLRLAAYPEFRFVESDLAERPAAEALFAPQAKKDSYQLVVHLAEQDRAANLMETEGYGAV